jgi:hypothetical protein
MSSQFNVYLASAHSADLHRSAAASRRAGKRTAGTRNSFPTFLRSRRLGRLVRISPEHGTSPAVKTQ